MITATVSHEMRTPINAILLMLQSLEMHIKGQPELKQMCDILKNSGKYLLYLVNDMLDVFMLKTGKFEKNEEPFNIKLHLMEIQELFKIQAKQKGIDLIFEFGQGS